jgi:hypothetical protein
MGGWSGEKIQIVFRPESKDNINVEDTMIVSTTAEAREYLKLGGGIFYDCLRCRI